MKPKICIYKINSVEIACVILRKQNSEIAGNILVLWLPVSKVYANRLSCMMLVEFDSCRSWLYLITLGSALNDQNLWDLSNSAGFITQKRSDSHV